jgi:hypothetical protein
MSERNDTVIQTPSRLEYRYRIIPDYTLRTTLTNIAGYRRAFQMPETLLERKYLKENRRSIEIPTTLS